jgi:DNA-binding transcriptional MerR regulator
MTNSSQLSFVPEIEAELAEAAPTFPIVVDATQATIIPDRFFFRIGDVSEITGIKPYVLRFWEKEFDLLQPVKNNAGQRMYRKADVESVLLIKKLLYLERYSIEGAKKRIKELRKAGDLASAKKTRGEMSEEKLSILADIRRDLQALVAFLD